MIKMSLSKLANTQGRILHVMVDSIPIVNVTRRKVSNNRHKIKELISNLKGIVDKRVSRLEILTHGNWLYKIMVDRLGKYFWASVVVMPRTILPRRDRRCALSLCCRHVEIRRRKRRKRCDLFYGGERDKPT